MDGFFEDISIGKIISFVVFIVYILSSLKGKGKEDEAEQDPDAQARARKIQEEIRRKILERQQGAPVVSPSREEPVEESPPLVFEREEYEETSVFTQQEDSAPQLKPEPAQFEDSYAEQRRLIEEQLEKAAVIRAKTQQHKHSEGYGTIHKSRSGSRMRGEVRNGLRNSASIKSAFVLKEILDTPIGLR